MSLGLPALVVIVSFFALMAAGLPIAFTFIATSIVYTLLFWSPDALYVAATTIYAQSTKEVFLAIPLFVFLAAVLEQSGIAENLYDMFYKWIGRLGGGLAIGCVLMCTILDAISGLGATGIVTVGPMALPEMFKRGYDRRMAMGSIAAASALGPLIPPSVIMIIIAGFTGLSVGKLFAAGLFPGLLCSLGFIVYIVTLCAARPEKGPPIAADVGITWPERLASLRAVVLPVLLIGAVMGSIYTGAATPTEGAAVGAFGALVCAAVNRQLTWRGLERAGRASLRITCMVMWLLIGGALFATLLNALGVQEALAGMLGRVHAGAGSGAVIAITMAIVFVMGMFIDGAAITVLTMPIFFPVIVSAGIDPLWFSTLFTINIVIGYLTPPFGMNLFYMKGIAPGNVSMLEIYKSIVPFVLVMIGVLVIVTLVPGIAVWLPNRAIQ